MTTEKSAQELRNEAAQARRLAGTLTLDAESRILLQYASELDLQAAALERKAGAAARPVHQQQQAQQQQASEVPPPPGRKD